MIYDYIIIGAGPTGLTLAYLLAKYNKTVAIIEKESYIGGCHGVKRINNLFTEHGPRIYIDNYVNFTHLLEDMGTKFTDIFTPYKFGKSDVFFKLSEKLSLFELFYLGIGFITINDSYKNMSLKDFLDYFNFSEDAKDILDRLGRLTDGGDYNKFTLYSFLQIINQNFLYTIYQPKKPNDQGLLKIWQEKLNQMNVKIYVNQEIQNIKTSNKKIIGVTTKNNDFNCDNLIFALPPYSINKIIKDTPLHNAFGNNFNKWSELTNYITYIPVVFHWKKKIELKKIWGFPETSWGIGSIILSDYMDFNDDRSKTVISTVITKNDKSDYLGKTPDEIPDKEIIMQEVLRELRTVYGNIEEPDNYFLEQNYYENNKWSSTHTAFMTTKYGFIENKSNFYENLYNCGMQNGNSEYTFTSLESSVINSINLVHELVPESKDEWKIKKITTIRYVIVITIILIMILILYCR